ncbi:MAG: restriction endonuclease, partial [Crocinitomicaceae bacterium]
MKITKTTNPIHFEDLDPMRFEDLAFSILYRIKKWHSINHLGRSGNDGGIDIDGTEINEDKSITKWLIQCKRYQKIGPKLAESIVRELNKKNPKFEYFHLIISCPLSRSGHEKLESLKVELGIKEILIWTNSHLEAMLYHELPDLLNIYFGIKT